MPPYMIMMRKEGAGLVTIDGISFTDTAIVKAAGIRVQSTLAVNGTTGRVHTSFKESSSGSFPSIATTFNVEQYNWDAVNTQVGSTLTPILSGGASTYLASDSIMDETNDHFYTYGFVSTGNSIYWETGVIRNGGVRTTDMMSLVQVRAATRLNDKTFFVYRDGNDSGRYHLGRLSGNDYYGSTFDVTTPELFNGLRGLYFMDSWGDYIYIHTTSSGNIHRFAKFQASDLAFVGDINVNIDLPDGADGFDGFAVYGEDKLVMMSKGNFYKYTPTGGLEFLGSPTLPQYGTNQVGGVKMVFNAASNRLFMNYRWTNDFNYIVEII